jgi:hypothetical protein
MALELSLDGYSDVSTALATPTLEIPTELQRTSDFGSTENLHPLRLTACHLPGYEGLDFARAEGFKLRTDDRELES